MKEFSICDRSDTKASSSSSSKLNDSFDKKEKEKSKEKKEKKESKKEKSKNKKLMKQALKEPVFSNVALNAPAIQFPESTELPKINNSKSVEQLPTDMSDSTDSESESKMELVFRSN